MECKYCKSSWNSTVNVAKCPFCGKQIQKETNDDMHLSEGISRIVSEYGIEILNDSKRLISLIMDYVRDCDKEKKLFRIACNCDILKIAKDIKESAENQRDPLIKKAIKKLEDEAFFSTENAEYIISLILIGLGITYRNEKEIIQAPRHQTVSNTQTVKLEIGSKSIENDDSVNIGSDENRLTSMVIGLLCGSEKDKENYLWSIVNENRRPTNAESAAIINLSRKLLKNGNTVEGIKLIKFTAQYGYAYGALFLGYCYDKGIGVTKDYNIATAYYERAGVSGGADESYKFHGWGDRTHRSRAYAVAEKIYNEGI